MWLMSKYEAKKSQLLTHEAEFQFLEFRGEKKAVTNK